MPPVIGRVLMIISQAIASLVLLIQRKLYSFSPKQVIQWNIVSRKKDEFSPVREKSFICSFRRKAPIETVLEPNNIAVEYDEQKVVLLNAPGSVYNSDKYPFFYHALFLEATAKITAPLDDFLDLIDNQPWPEINVIFLWSVGRCGSTLLANLFTSFNGFVTISEPDDIFNSFAHKSKMTETQFDKVLRNSLKFHLIQASKIFPGTKCVIIKPRSMAFWYITRSPLEIRHSTTHIFMYRDVVPTFRSFERAFGKLAPKLDSLVAKIAQLPAMVKGAMEPMEFVLSEMSDTKAVVDEARAVRLSSNEMLVQMSFGGLPYILLLYKKLAESGTFEDRLFAVKYERLIENPVHQFELIASRVKSFNFTITEEERDRLLTLSRKDSQENSALSRKNLGANKADDANGENFQKFQEMMSACQLEAEREHGHILPNTV